MDQGGEFYNKLIQEWLVNNDILMYSTHTEDKSVIVERFITSIRKWHLTIAKLYLNKSADQCNNTILLAKKLLMLIILLWMKKLRLILKILSIKLMI